MKATITFERCGCSIEHKIDGIDRYVIEDDMFVFLGGDRTHIYPVGKVTNCIIEK